MIKKLCFTFLILFLGLHVHAFEGYIVTTDGKLTDISIEDNKIIDVYPLVTIMNQKNTLIVHPLKEGKTTFSVLKNNKQKYEFDVVVRKNETIVTGSDKFEILSIDLPPVQNEILDLPPQIQSEGE